MSTLHLAKRYQVGYNAPITGAAGNSPQEAHFVGDFAVLADAIAEVNALGNPMRHPYRPFIVDTVTNKVVALVIGSDGKSYQVDDQNIPG